jgi:hypothetical protein
VKAVPAPPFPASDIPFAYSLHVKLPVTAEIVKKQITLWVLRRKNVWRANRQAERPVVTVIQKVLHPAVFSKHEMHVQTSALPQLKQTVLLPVRVNTCGVRTEMFAKKCIKIQWKY